MSAKELLWLWRNPQRSAGFALNVGVLDGLAILLVPRLSSLDASLAPGLALFGVGTLLILGIGAALLELEQPALWHWATLPRSLSSVFAQKALFAAALATLAALPVALYALRDAPSFRAAAPGLLYAVICLVLLTFVQAALWLGRVSQSTATSAVRHALRSLQIGVVAVILGAGFAPRTPLASLVPVFVLVVAFAFALWQAAVQRLPFALDQSSRPPVTLTATFALVVIVSTRTLQVQLHTASLGHGLPPATAATLAIGFAGVVGLSAGLLWLYHRGLAGLAERLGLSAGRGPRVILREALLWSVPAIVVNLGYWWLVGAGSVHSSGQGAQPPTMMTQLAGSSLAVIAVGCVAVPVLEEILFRGMLYRALRAGSSVVLSVFVSSAVFMVDHTLVAALPIVFASVCITLAFERSRSLYAAMLVHASYNGVIAAMMLAR